MNKVQEKLINMLGLELNEDFIFFDDRYKFIDDKIAGFLLLKRSGSKHDWKSARQDIFTILVFPEEIKVISKSILDFKEKEYLKAVLKPYKNEINYVQKVDCGDNIGYIFCSVNDVDSLTLPIFKLNTMYKGMESNKEYTLKELGLFEE